MKLITFTILSRSRSIPRLLILAVFVHIVSCKSSEPQFRLRSLPNKMVLAILPFDDKTKSKYGPESVDIIQNTMVSQLISSQQFRIIERTKVNALLKEIEQSQAGTSQSDAQLKIGKMLNADALLVGNIDNINIERNERTLLGLADMKRLKIQCSLSARIILTETSEILSAGEADMKDSETSFLSMIVAQGKQLDTKGLQLALAKEASIQLAKKLQKNLN